MNRSPLLRIAAGQIFLALAFFVCTILGAAALVACDSGSSTGGSTATTVPTQNGSTAPSAGDPTRGQAVFARYCNACHPGGAQGSGPSLIQRMPHTSDE